MDVLTGILYILLGIGLLGFGIFLFYLLLPVFYGFLGFGVGLIVADYLNVEQSVGLIFGIIGAVIFVLLTWQLEMLRRILIGIGFGILLGAAVANALAVDNTARLIIVVVGAIIGAFIALAIFDGFIIAASSIAGANFVLAGLFIVTDDITFRINDIATGETIALIIWAALAVLGIAWQLANLARLKLRARVP